MVAFLRATSQKRSPFPFCVHAAGASIIAKVGGIVGLDKHQTGNSGLTHEVNIELHVAGVAQRGSVNLGSVL